MLRKKLFGGLLLVFLAPRVLVLGEAALLDVLGRCIWGGGGPLSPIELRREPFEELSAIPPLEGLFFGEIAIGNGRDPIISVAIWEGEGSPRLWIDANNDENMLNDNGSQWAIHGGWECFSWLTDVLVDYEENGVNTSVPVPLVVTAVPNHGPENPPWYNYIPYVIGYRSGLLDIGDELRRIAVVDGNWDGLYDTKHLWVYLDTDGDGVICRWCPHEVFLPGEVIQIGNRAYRVSSITPSGRKLELAPYDGPFNPRPVLLPGRPLPDWSLETLQGERVTISNWRGQVMVICLLKGATCLSDDASSCPACQMGCKRVREIGQELGGLVSTDPEYAGKVSLVLILADPNRPPEEWVGRWPGWDVVWAPQLAETVPIYMNDFLIIVDGNGLIKYTDEAITHWDSMGCKAFAPRRARGIDVLWAIDRILAVEGKRN